MDIFGSTSELGIGVDRRPCLWSSTRAQDAARAAAFLVVSRKVIRPVELGHAGIGRRLNQFVVLILQAPRPDSRAELGSMTRRCLPPLRASAVVFAHELDQTVGTEVIGMDLEFPDQNADRRHPAAERHTT